MLTIIYTRFYLQRILDLWSFAHYLKTIQSGERYIIILTYEIEMECLLLNIYYMSAT